MHLDKIVFGQRLRGEKVPAFSQAGAGVVAREACGRPSHWARELVLTPGKMQPFDAPPRCPTPSGVS